MQISGLAAGPKMAASEPPEPPPRNPDRINASLHKLSESKIIKSLDSSVSLLKDKTANNNKPIRPLLSLDHSSQLATAPSTSAAAAAAAQTRLPAVTAGPPPILLASKRDLTPIAAGGSCSPGSSNDSNHTLTPPMSSDSQQAVTAQQQQQQQQHRLITAYSANMGPGKADLPLANNGSSTGVLHASNIIQAVGAHSAQGNGSSSGSGSGSGCSVLNAALGKFAQLEQPTVVPTSPPAAPTSPASAAAAALLRLETTTAQAGQANGCDNNRNDKSKLPLRPDATAKLREENERLNAELTRLRRLLENSTDGAVGGVDPADDAQSRSSGSAASAQQRTDRLESELNSVKNQLLTMRLERKKLRIDKGDLLGQVKQLCVSLQEKEQELRDFIRNYQERVRERESTNAKLSGDRDRERFQLLKQARDEAERSLSLAQQLSTRDLQLQRLQEQLLEARRQLGGCLSDQESLHSFAPPTPPSAASGMLSQQTTTTTISVPLNAMRPEDSGRGNSNSLSAFSGSLSGGSGATAADRTSMFTESGVRNMPERDSAAGEVSFAEANCDNGPCITIDPDSISLISSQNIYQFGTPKERSPTLSPLNSAAYSRSVEQLGSPVDGEGSGAGAITKKFPAKAGPLLARNGRGGTWGSISRVFARSRNKNKALSADGVTEFSDISWSQMTEETYAEKMRLLREASQLPMERWRATQVLAWLEMALGMPQYSTRCTENVKSGKVLLELNDVELEAGLGLTHPMHRKKLRLAIEEQRRPELVRYPLITQLGHTWVASEWLSDIGLPQYSEPFLHSLVDARMLDTLSKKELEKFLGVTRKFHQASIVHGIHVLRIVKYDRQTLAMRRIQSESVDTDPIVWTNQRFIRWVRSIDLGEYADNLKDSGVHGGLVVLEPSFSGDTMATALGVPPSKNIIRRHLNTEFDALILPARATLGQGIRSGCGIVPLTGPGGLQQHATTDRRSSGSLRISAWKGSQSSLSKAFRFNSKSHRTGDRSSFGNSTSPTPSYSSSEGGGGIYATIGAQQQLMLAQQQQQQQQQQPQQYQPTYSHQQYHFLPPPTTAPPPPPTSGNYGPPAHRVSAPPNGCTLDSSFGDVHLLYEQQRRVKSISDIGVAVTASPSAGSGSVGACSLGGISGSSDSHSPV